MWGDLSRQFPEVLQLVEDFKFSGQGQIQMLAEMSVGPLDFDVVPVRTQPHAYALPTHTHCPRASASHELSDPPATPRIKIISAGYHYAPSPLVGTSRGPSNHGQWFPNI